MSKVYRAIALYSGGLDSLLAVKWMSKLGVDVIPVFYRTPFFPEHRAMQTALANGLHLEVYDITNEHLEMLLNPVYGFGKNFNPCIDCHGLMFKTAGVMLEKYSADFVISGEVLSQRPMSQRKDAMNAVSKLSGIGDLLVRPLSQKLLPDTKPIRDGWINKTNLLDFSGRSRKPQIALAKELGITEFPNPAGGCSLTDANFTIRLKELLDHNQLNIPDIELLRFGRHFRIDDSTKLIIGRDEADNNHILSYKSNYTLLLNESMPGPLGLLCDIQPSLSKLTKAAEFLAYYYTKSPDKVQISYGSDFPLLNTLQVKKASSDVVQEYLIARKF